MEMSGSTSQAKLDALSEAIRAVTSDLSLEHVLRRLAEISAHLVDARYAALGVPNETGGLDKFFTYGMSESEISQMDHYPRGLGLLDALLKSDEPIRLADMRTDPRSAGFCEMHPSMTSFLGVPIISKGKNLGSLYLCDRLDNQLFSADDERLVKMLAAHAAVAIENATLSDRLRRLAILEERDRIAMELHDGIIQSIYAIGIKIELARGALDKIVAEENRVEERTTIDGQLRSAEQSLNRVIEDLRRYIRDLKLGVNLSTNLNNQIAEISEAFRSVSSARLVVDVAPAVRQLTEARVHGLVQIVREALSNIARHADATEVSLEMYETSTSLVLVIADNGIGFSAQTIVRGRGLQNMQDRAQQLGGSLNVASIEDHGATLTLTLPIE